MPQIPNAPAAGPYDFQAEAKALLKRLESNPEHPNQLALRLASVEAALREAYRRGQSAKAGPLLSPPKAPSQPAPRPATAKTSSIPSADPAEECSHQWEEADEDDHTLEIRCVECGLLQREIQAKCKHYFVDTGGGAEVCMACRKPKRAR